MKMKRSRLLGVALILVLIAGLVWLLWLKPDSSSSPQAPAASSSAPQEPSGDSSSLYQEKQTLNERVKTFVSLYFSLDEHICADEAAFKQALKPYITRQFLDQEDAAGICDVGSSEHAAPSGENMEASAESDLNGEISDDGRYVHGVVSVHIVKYDKSGKEILNFTYPQPMQWVKQGNTWLLDSLS